MKYTKTTQQENIEQLKKLLKPGDTIYTVLDHVSKSGMMRYITVLKIENNQPYYLNYSVARSLDMPEAKDGNRGIKVTGAGMDMGYDLVSNLARTLFGDYKQLNQRWL